jgi:hypothetical protein
VIFAVVAAAFGAIGACGGGSSSGGTTATRVTISGTATYDRVPHTASGALDYANTAIRPVRGATVELRKAADDSVIASTTTSGAGTFSLTAPLNTDVYVRVRAEMVRTGSPGWNFRVVDNTNAGALYVMDGASFNSGDSNVTRNLHAASGWGGSSYTGTRAAAPFAILDDVYVAFHKVLSVSPNQSFPALVLNWSVDNVPSGNDPSIGQIGTTYYSGAEKAIYVLGKADNDTDEFDDHVIVHEWGHYLEDNFSRSDTTGGTHGAGDRLDMRLAFGEGWGNAWSGIATDDPLYQDSSGVAQASGFNINVESNPSFHTGWYSEESLQSILYDLYDSTNDGADNVSLGFGPIWQVLTQQERDTPALTSIFPFITALKADNPADAAAIDNLVGSQNIDSAGIDAWGSNETHKPNAADLDVLPIYHDYTVGDPAITVCTNSQYDATGDGNKLSERQFVRFTPPADGTYQFTAKGDNKSDPDIVLFDRGEVHRSEQDSSATHAEQASWALTGGDVYVLEVYDYAAMTSGDTTRRGCVDVTIN